MHAQDNEGLFKSAMSDFVDKEFDGSIQQYEKIIEGGNHSVALYNNLGSAHYEKGDYAHAVLYFEKGLKLSPFNKSILHNLNLTREQLDNDIVPIPEFFLARLWKYFFSLLSSNVWLMLSLLTLCMCVYAFGIWLLHAVRSRKKKGFIAGSCLLVLGIVMFFLSKSQASFQHQSRTGIVLASAIPLKSAPEEANEPIMILEPGVKLYIIDEIGEYEKVKLENGQIGWVSKEGYEPI